MFEFLLDELPNLFVVVVVVFIVAVAAVVVFFTAVVVFVAAVVVCIVVLAVVCIVFVIMYCNSCETVSQSMRGVGDLPGRGGLRRLSLAGAPSCTTFSTTGALSTTTGAPSCILITLRASFFSRYLVPGAGWRGR